MDSEEPRLAPVGRNAVTAELFHRRGADLIGLARTLVDTRDEAEEVVQEAFARLVAAFGRLDPARADGYVTVTVLNLARSRLRRRRTARIYLERPRPPVVADDESERSDAARIVRARVAALPPRQQACIVDPTDLSVEADLGLHTFGGPLACLTGERVAISAYDAIPADLSAGQQAAIVPGSRRIVIVDRDGEIRLPPDPDVWVHGRNAID